MRAKVSRYWHTLRYLRPVQVYGRALHRFRRPRPDTRPAPPVRRAPGAPWAAPVPHPMSLVAPDTHTFLGETHSLAAHGWDDETVSKLWRYNLHYFDHLSAEASAEQRAWQRALVERWVRENPPGAGSGWEPFPTSLRIVNWIKWALAGNVLPAECVQSLAVQARWLTRRLEIHLLGNHLFANAKALVFAGLWFEGREADGWLAAGLRLLAREIPEQILADGGQFERTPMYHALAVEDMLDLVNVAARYDDRIPRASRTFVDSWRPRAHAMLGWLGAMTHPDGEIAFFNDAAIGIAPAPDALRAYAARLGDTAPPRSPTGLTVLAQSGYVRNEWDGAVALLDVAPVGPDYLPGHAHADTLSFELSLFGQRVFVNSGTSVYGTGAERLRQRGTAAHNTVVVDGEDSSEVWSGFRVARRARPKDLVIERADPLVVRCAHDGYRRLRGRPEHERRWTFRNAALVVEDRVTGTFRSAEARYHLHPAVQVHPVTSADGLPQRVELVLPEGQRVLVTVAAGRLRTEESTWHPRFGASIPNRCLVVALEGAHARVTISWDQSAS